MTPERTPKNVLDMMSINPTKLEAWVYELHKKSILTKNQEFSRIYNYAKFISECHKFSSFLLRSKRKELDFEDICTNKKFLKLLASVIDLSFKQTEENILHMHDNSREIEEILNIIEFINTKFNAWQASNNKVEFIKTTALLTEKLLLLEEPAEITQHKHDLLQKARTTNPKAVEFLELMIYTQDCAKNYIASLMRKIYGSKQLISNHFREQQDFFSAAVKLENKLPTSSTERMGLADTLEDMQEQQANTRETIKHKTIVASIKKSIQLLSSHLGLINPRKRAETLNSRDSNRSFIELDNDVTEEQHGNKHSSVVTAPIDPNDNTNQNLAAALKDPMFSNKKRRSSTPDF